MVFRNVLQKHTLIVLYILFYYFNYMSAKIFFVLTPHFFMRDMTEIDKACSFYNLNIYFICSLAKVLIISAFNYLEIQFYSLLFYCLILNLFI